MVEYEKKHKSDTAENFLKICFVFMLVCASMGEWKVINSALGGLPKAICMGVIFTAALYAFVKPNLKKAAQLLPPTLMYLSLIVLLMLWSLAIWIMNFTDVSSVVRGGSKMVFQTISIMTAVSAVYMFGLESINLFTVSLCITNSLIMILEIPNYGLAESITSLINCVVKFGDAIGYARALEIHDLTFVFGQLIIYYAIFAPRKTRTEKKKRNCFLALCIFFFTVGMKRIAIPAVILFILFAMILKKRKKLNMFFVLYGIGMTAFFMVFICGVRSGGVSELCARFGIDMMGREYLWKLAGDYYSFSPMYMGKGFEFVDTIVTQWYNEGIIKLALMFHNDILKVFVEMGFPGFLIWSLVQYLVYPVFFAKYADTKTAVLYTSVLGYMTFTYLTDNTAFYFWSTMGLKLIVLAYAVYRKKESSEKNAWKPPEKNDIKARTQELLMYENEKNSTATEGENG